MAPPRTEEDGFDVTIKEVPVTRERRPFIQKAGDEKLRQPGKYMLIPLKSPPPDEIHRNRKSK
jgi:hypothetical protein